MINIDKLIVKNSKTEGFHEEDFAKWSRIASPSTQVTARHPTRRTRDPVQPETTPNRNRDQQQPGFHHAWMWQKFGLTSKNGTWEQYVAWHQPWYSSVAKVWMIWKGIYIYGKKRNNSLMIWAPIFTRKIAYNPGQGYIPLKPWSFKGTKASQKVSGQQQE